MALPSYYQIEQAIGVPRCRGIRNGSRCYRNHERGEIEGGFVHWRDRRVLHEGIYNFLKLSATFIVANDHRLPEPDWSIRYRALKLIPQLAKDVHVQIPRKLGANDRAELAGMLMRVPGSTPGRSEALDWARR